MDEDEIHRQLSAMSSQFDFGEYEAKAYVTILKHGTLTASEVAEHADIPQPRVYDTVRGLADIGLIELHETRPMRAVAVDPDEGFTDIQTTLEDLVSDLSEQFHRPAREGDVVSLVKSRQTVLRYLEDVISTAEYELVVSMTPDLLGRYESELRDCREAGVTIDLLVSPARETPEPETYDYEQVATTARTRRGVTTAVVAVADGRYSVYTPRSTLTNEGGPDSYGVIFNRSELGFLVSAFLNTVVWPSAKTIAAVDDDRPFPRRYASVRRCVEELDGFEGSFYATVRGREIESGKRLTLRGPIVDTAVGANRETAAITVETDSGPVDVGGQLAALEDVEAHELAVGREEPPTLVSDSV